MLTKLIGLYTTAMQNDVRSPVPHVVGPPGVGKSLSVERLAELLEVNLHVVNVSRLNPIELEGVQMPEGVGDAMRLRLLHNTLWSQLQEGDIVLWDEFLRGFPEVYNGLLDIMTSRHVAGLDLPKVFFVAASNSVVAYDPALEDRLLHIPVPDIRENSAAASRTSFEYTGPENLHRRKAMERFISDHGLHPSMIESEELRDLITLEVDPMYSLLDSFKRTGAKRLVAGAAPLEGSSLRKLGGQLQLREIRTPSLKALMTANNRRASTEGKHQYLIYYPGYQLQERDEEMMRSLQGNDKLTPIQSSNLDLSIKLIDMIEEVNDNETERDS